MRRSLPLAVVALVGSASVCPAVAPESVSLAAREWLSAHAAPAASFLPGSPEMGDDWERDDWDWAEQGPERVGDGTKSMLGAVVASALLPGLGERYVGRPGRAKLFHAVEGVIWTTFGAYRIQGDRRKDRYIEFAQVRGGAPGEEDSEYYEHIGLWISLEEWHDIVRRDARLTFPDDPGAQAAFFERNKRYDEGEFWEWPDDQTRVQYRRLRSRSERSYRNGRLAVGAAIVNRLASMIDALALARAHNKGIREEARVEIRFAPQQTVDGLVFGPVLSTRY